MHEHYRLALSTAFYCGGAKSDFYLHDARSAYLPYYIATCTCNNYQQWGETDSPWSVFT